MAERGTRSYPPVGDPDRLDSILARGRSLRRRRQLVASGAGAGGALAVVLVAVLVLGGGSGDGGGEDQRQFADDDTSTTTTTTTTAPPTAEMSVELLEGPARVRVDDPAQPDADGTQQCLWVRVLPTGGAWAVAEGTTCAPGLSTGGQADLALVLTSSSESGGQGAGSSPGTGPDAEVGTDLGDGPGVEIGCAAFAVNPAPEAITGTATRPGVTTFTLSAPELAPGDYTVEVFAVSGIGDGCPPEQDGLERENVAEATGTVTLP